MKMQFVMKYAFLNFILFYFRLWGHSDCKSWTESDQYEFAPNNLDRIYSISIESDFVY